MIISNKLFGVKVKCGLEDVYIDLSHLSIRCRLNGDKTAMLCQCKDGDDLVERFDHMVRAFLCEKQIGADGLIYEIGEHGCEQ